MRILAFTALALGFGLTAIQLSACSNSSDDCNATATCGATAGSSHAGNSGKSGSGSTDAGASNGGSSGTSGSSNTSGSAGVMGGGGDGGAGGSACTGDVSDDAACWTTNDLGVFVSSDTGDDTTGNGTKEMPFKTITKGIASASGKNVYVCVGAADYSEKISLDLASDGIQIYGGFECATWTYATTRSAQVLSPSNIALRIDGLKKGAHIENVSFKAADATGTGTDASSYGAFVTNAKGVVFKNVKVVAGKGANGHDGDAGVKGMDGATVPAADDAPQKGKPAKCSTPPATQLGGAWSEQASYGTLGGIGGTGRLDAGLSGGNGDPGTPTTGVALPGTDNSGAGATTVGVKGARGGDGSEGLHGEVGAAAAPAGEFSSKGFTPADGLIGKEGFTGQGGGGGGASKGNGVCVGASGGAGGMGGEGGAPGAGGSGGGASVALLSWNSQIVASSALFNAAAGGAGGSGGGGGLHGQGGYGAPGGLGSGQIDDGGRGGDGGDGGDGGSGSGGTGGPSYALVYSGSKPTYDPADTTLTPGVGGDPGVGGSVSEIHAPDGLAGESATDLEVK
ncbi:MAG: hypothetical protein ABUL60_00860 [Myxococcales bacterium]